MTTTTGTLSRTELLDLAGGLADEFATRAADHDRDASFPHENVELLRRENLLNFALPLEYGGRGAGLHDYALFARRLAHGCESSALGWVMHNWFAGMVATLWRGSEGAMRLRLEAILEELAGGSLASGMFAEPGTFGFTVSEVTAERVEGGYRLNGRKLFWSNQPGAAFVSTSALRDRDTILFYMGPLAEITGLRVVEDWNTMGMRATSSNGAVFEDAFISDKWVWELPAGRYGDAVGAVGGIWFGQGVAAVYGGIAEAARNYAVEWAAAREKFPFPTGLDKKPYALMPHAQITVAEMDVLLQAMDHALRCTALDREADPAWGMAEMVEGWRTKQFVTTNAVQVVDKALSLVGGAGYHRRSPLERWYRSVRAGEFHPLAWPDLSVYSGKLALGLDPHCEPRFV